MIGSFCHDSQQGWKIKKVLLIAAALSSVLGAEELSTEVKVEKIENTRAYGLGVEYGRDVLPDAIENMKIQGQMDSATLEKGCSFIVSFGGQYPNTNSESHTMAIKGCEDGYRQYIEASL